MTAVAATVGLDGDRALQALLAKHAPDLPLDEQGGFGVLSIDVDGIDYWIWESLSTLRPAVVVIEVYAAAATALLAMSGVLVSRCQTRLCGCARKEAGGGTWWSVC